MPDLVVARAVRSPYKGLAPYTDDDADIFFGRDLARQILVANLMSARLTVVYGASGVGKSSLLHAGAVHHLIRQARRNLEDFGTPEFLVVQFSAWQNDPLAGIAAAIGAAADRVLGGGHPAPAAEAGATLADTISAWTKALDVDLLFIFDQFEEYFLYHSNADPFMQQFPVAVNRDDLRANFIVALREDRLAKLDRFKSAIDGNVFENNLRVRHLDRAAAGDAILGPLDVHNRAADAPMTVEPELVEAVLDQVTRGKVLIGERDGAAGVRTAGAEQREERVETPFLQLVMSRLWDVATASGSSALRLDMLERLGGAEAIVRSHLTDAMDALDDRSRAVAADAFRFLVTPGGSKIALASADLAVFTDDPADEIDAVLHHLAAGSMSILRTVPPPPGGMAPRYEIFHDVLAGAITEWQTAFDERRRADETTRELAAQSRRWRRRALAVLGLVIATIAAATLAIVLVNNARHDAEFERLMSEARVRIDPQTDLENALVAAEARRRPESLVAVRRALSATHPIAIVRDHDAQVWSALFSPDGASIVTASEDGVALVLDATSGAVRLRLEGHEGRVNGASYTPDARHIVTWSDDGTARVWDAGTGAELHVLPHGDDVAVFASSSDARDAAGGYVATGPFSSDGRTIVTVTGSYAFVWDLQTGELLRQLEPPDAGWINSAAYSADGRAIVTAGADGITRIWSAQSGEVERELRLDDGLPVAQRSTFNPNGDRVVTAYDGGRLVLWDANDGTALSDLHPHSDDLVDLGFSGDGSRLLTTGVRSMNAYAFDGARDMTYKATTFTGDGVLTPDARHVAVAVADGTVELVDVISGASLIELKGHENIVWRVDVSPAGDRIATAGEDGTVRIWPLPDGIVINAAAGRSSPALFDPSGSRVVTAEFDGVARIRDAATGETMVELVGEVTGSDTTSFPMRYAAFDADGGRITTVQSTAVYLWDAMTGERLGVCCSTGWDSWGAAYLHGREDTVIALYADNSARVWELADGDSTEIHVFDDSIFVGWSEDGSVIATLGRDDGLVKIWDGATFEPVRSWKTGLVLSINLSYDGTTMATPIRGGVIVWDVATASEIARLPVEPTTLAFSRDGERVVVGEPDGRVSVWETDGSYLGAVKAHSDAVGSLHVSATGLIASSGWDGTVRLFTCDVCDLTDDELLDEAHRRLLPSD